MFSQRDEEKYILDYFKNSKGVFLDIGAWEGKTFSNTHALALKGWSGICVEPSPSVIGALRKLYENRKDIEVFNVCIGNINGDVDFYDAGGDATSSTNPAELIHWERCYGTKFKKIKVPMLTFETLVKNSIYTNFDFISIDVEDDKLGKSILQQIDLQKYKVKMICIEASSMRSEIIKYFDDRKYKLIYNSGAENIVVAL